MKDNKSELENGLNSQDRGKLKEINWIRDKLISAEQSGFTEMTKEEILAESKILYDQIESHKTNPTSSWEVFKSRVKKQQ